MLVSIAISRALRTYALLGVLAITCACAPSRNVQTPTVAVVTPLEAANRSLQQGNYRAAADAFAALGADAAPLSAMRYNSIAAIAYQDIGAFAAADALLSTTSALGVPDSTTLRVAKARSMLKAGANAEAYAIAVALDTSDLSPYERGAHLRCLGDAALLSGHIEDAARAWTAAYSYPFPAELATVAAESTWRAVSRLGLPVLRRLAEDPDARSAGWYEFAISAARGLSAPTQQSALVSEWQERFPGHPAHSLIEEVLERNEMLRVKPRHIALLLPFDATLGSAAEAIRDGFISAWYEDPEMNSRPAISVYSTADEPLDATVEKLIQNEVDFIVGPLQKTLVEQLKRRSDVNINVLALNVVETQANGNPGFFQFGLAPDEEAKQVARYASATGKRALIITPDTPWGERLQDAYGQSWRDQGGEVVSEISHRENSDAYSVAVKRALNVDLSEDRAKALRRRLGLSLHTEARRRRDVDVILLGEFPGGARQIMPHLRYFRADDIPVFATSHVFRGTPDPENDVDLDGIVFGDMPWISGSSERNLYELIKQAWPQRVSSFVRLYALGIDAYRVIPYLARMRFQPGLRVPGVSGDLHMSPDGVLHRSVRWMRFAAGMPTPVDIEGVRAGGT